MSGGLSEAETIAVRVDTFDQWFATSGLASVDLVKIDVEGAEARVIAGMREALQSGRLGALVCETSWDGPAQRALLAAGFVARPLESIGDLTNVLFTAGGGE